MSKNKKKESKILSADEILLTDDLKIQVVEVPEWGGSVRVRTMNGFERDEFEAMIARQTTGEGPAAKVDMRGMKIKLISLTLVDEEGKPLFSDKQVRGLEKKSGKVLHDLFEVISKMNGLGEEQLEELAKNLSGGPSAANGSSSLDK